MIRRSQTRAMVSSKNARTSIAIQRVLDTLELFEMILLYLPMEDLLLAQRVSRMWKQTIERSNRLQEALFFRPSSVPARLYASAPRTADQLSESTSQSLPRKGALLTREHFQRNPLLQMKFDPFFSQPASQFSLPTRKDLTTMSWATSRRSSAAYRHADASWRKMLVVQPASVIVCEVIYMTHAQLGDTLTVADKTIDPLKQGLRMGWIYDLCYDMAIRSGGCFTLRWDMLKSQKLWAPKLSVFLKQTFSCVRSSYSLDELKALQSLKSDGYSKVVLKSRPHDFVKKMRQAYANDGRTLHSYRVPSDLILDEEDQGVKSR